MAPLLEAEESAELHGQNWLWSTCDGFYNEAKELTPRGGTGTTEPHSGGPEGRILGDEDTGLFSETGLPPAKGPMSFWPLSQKDTGLTTSLTQYDTLQSD